MLQAINMLPPARRRLLTSMVEAYGTAYFAGQKISDKGLLSLPHHRRVALNDAIALEARFLEEFAPEVVAEAKREDSTRHSIASCMAERYPFLAREIYQGHFDVLCDIGLRLMGYYGRIRSFQTTNALEDLLWQTDFGDDVPAEWLRTPFRDVYIEFGEHRRFPVSISDPSSGQHVIEGCYLLSGLSARPSGERGLVRGFDVIIFGSPVGKVGLLNDTFTHMGLPIEDETMPIAQLVDEVVRRYEERDDFPNAAIFRPVLTHVAKVLVYLSTADARQVIRRDGSEAAAQLAALKSPGKRAKAARRTAALYDRIVVGPEHAPANFGGSSSGAAVRPHVRRGHIRSQPYGPQNSLRRPRWIQPMLIGSTSLTGVATPHYMVR